MKSYVGGGFKTIIDGPSQSKVMTDVSGFDVQKPVHRDSEVHRVVVARNVNIQVGTITVKLLKNGSETGEQKVYTSSDPANHQYSVWSPSSTVSVVVGDTLGLKVETSSDLDYGVASNIDFQAGIEVES